MNRAPTKPPEVASPEALKSFHDQIHRLEQEHPEGLTLEQIQAVANQVTSSVHERPPGHDHRPTGRR